MDKIQLQVAVENAMQGDNRISDQERSAIVGRALAGDGISVEELVAARGLLASSRKSLDRANIRFAAADARYNAATGLDKAEAWFDRAEAAGRVRLANNRTEGLQDIEREFSASANVIVKVAAGAVDIGRAIGDVFE